MSIQWSTGNILNGNHKIIVFGVNAEGVNDAGFAGLVSRLYWPKLATIGPSPLGSMHTKEVNGVTFHALVIHDLTEIGWTEADTLLKALLNEIKKQHPGEQISIQSMGEGCIATEIRGANQDLIYEAIASLNMDVVLYRRMITR